MPISGLYRKTHCCAVKPEIRKRLYHRSPVLTIAGAVTLLMSRIRLCSRYSCPARKLCLVTWSHLLTTYNACAISKHAKSKEHSGHLSLINCHRRLDRDIFWHGFAMKQGSILSVNCHKAFVICMFFSNTFWMKWNWYDKRYNWTTLAVFTALTLKKQTNTEHNTSLAVYTALTLKKQQTQNTTHLEKKHMKDLLQFQGAYNATACSWLRVSEVFASTHMKAFSSSTVASHIEFFQLLDTSLACPGSRHGLLP